MILLPLISKFADEIECGDTMLIQQETIVALQTHMPTTECDHESIIILGLDRARDYVIWECLPGDNVLVVAI